MSDNTDQGRVILVTGAASGIGAALCRRIAGQGTRLLLSRDAGFITGQSIHVDGGLTLA